MSLEAASKRSAHKETVSNSGVTPIGDHKTYSPSISGLN